MSVLPASVKPSVSVLLLLCGVALALAIGPQRAVVRAQTATGSGTSTSSGTATQSGSTYSATSSGVGGVGSSTLPDELPATGSNDVLISFAIGAFLVLAGLVGRVTLVHVLHESEE